MLDWKEQTKKLSEAIKDGEVYKEYAHYKELITRDQELNRMVNEYRKESFAMRLEDKENWMNHYDGLRARYESSLMIPEVEKYLMAEMKLCRLYRNVWETLCEDCDLDVDFYI